MRVRVLKPELETSKREREKMKRDILFLCQFFYPEYNSSATLPFDTARYLAQSGYSVGALCGYPREYNASGKVPVRETKNGVSIRRLHYIQTTVICIIRIVGRSMLPFARSRTETRLRLPLKPRAEKKPMNCSRF